MSSPHPTAHVVTDPAASGTVTTAPAHEPASVAITARDAVWDGYHFAMLAGPLDTVDPGRFRAALAARTDEAPFLLWRRRDARAWHPVPAAARGAHLDELLVADPGLDGSAASVESVLRRPLAGLPLQVVVGPRHVAVHFDHVLGDASVMAVWEWLVRQGADPAWAAAQKAVAVPTVVGGPSPFALAWRHTFGRVPPLSALVSTAALVRRERAGQRTGAPPPAGWEPRASVELAAGGPAGAQALREHRRTRPEASSQVLLLTAVWSVLREHGVVEAHVQPCVGTDLRRYLPRRTTAPGNLTTVVRLPAGLAPDPGAVQSALDAAGTSGVPLLAASGQAALAALRHGVRGATLGGVGASEIVGAALRRARRTGDGDAGPEDRLHHAPSLTLNHFGRLAGWERFAWEAGSPRTLVTAPSVDSSRAVTVNALEAVDGFHLVASFNDSVTSRTAVRAALDDLQERLPEVLSALS